MRVIIGVVLLSVVTHGLDVLIRDHKTPIKKKELVARIPILAKSYKISFDINPNFYSLDSKNILFFEDGTNVGNFHLGILGFWYQNDGFVINAPINGKSYQKKILDKFPLNVWTNIVISQQLNDRNFYYFTVNVNGENAFSIDNKNTEVFKNVAVYASNSWNLPFDGSIKNLTLENGEPGEHLPPAVLNPKDFVLNTDKEILKNDNLVAVLSKLKKSFIISFDLKLNSFSNEIRSVIHLTLGEDNVKYGDRIPGVWISKQKLQVVFAINGNNNNLFESKPLPLDVWINVDILQQYEWGLNYFYVYINNKKVYEILNRNERLFTNVKVYAGDPWHEAQDGSIQNFRVFNIC
ncbi:uncharacterized protein LOC100205312 [Hydra vulgaris]|uniref:uncharacterized protein LOC100205312 n=1 Tax=Hydra vulgaris TaxID=6087 RepID=UPI0002B455AB|nr:uncharacterized protein LOC100205312 isoform X2 [Hydra vulgaris]